jgi:hypothetical protein
MIASAAINIMHMMVRRPMWSTPDDIGKLPTTGGALTRSRSRAQEDIAHGWRLRATRRQLLKTVTFEGGNFLKMSVADSRFPSPRRRGRRSRGELAERDREQARAQQHEAGCGQREEAVRYAIVGHEIMGSHHTPATLDAGPNLLKVSESLS